MSQIVFDVGDVVCLNSESIKLYVVQRMTVMEGPFKTEKPGKWKKGDYKCGWYGKDGKFLSGFFPGPVLREWVEEMPSIHDGGSSDEAPEPTNSTPVRKELTEGDTR